MAVQLQQLPNKVFNYGLTLVTGSLQTFGRAIQLGVKSVRYVITDGLTGRLSYREVLAQCWFIVGVTALPALLVAVPFGVILSVQVGSLTQQVGATSLAGAAGGLGVIRQGAPMVAAILLGGAAGSAIAADLGAATIREEIDAVRTLGIDPTQRMVAPRVLAMLLIAPLLCIEIVFVGLAAGYGINTIVMDSTPGSYISSFSEFATVTDLNIAILKSALFGLVVVVIACQRGLEVKGGPRGVADAVNAAVVLGVIAVFVLNLVITQLVTMFFPQKIG